MLDFVMDLQLFADDDPEETEVDVSPEEKDAEESLVGDGESETPPDDEALDQEHIQRIIDRKFRQWNKRLERQLGTSDLEQISEAYRAGMAVAQAAGITPRDVIGRLNNNSAGGTTMGAQQPDVMQELQKLQNLVMGQYQAQAIEQQRAEARKEFGSMFDEYALEIEDMAEERGLSLVDAAAVVLRPHLGQIYQRKLQAQTQNRRKKVDGSDAPPASGAVDIVSKLTPAQIQVAKAMGLTPKEYAEQLQEMGKLE